MNQAENQQRQNSTGMVYRIVWYGMVIILAMIIALQQLGFGERNPIVVTVLSHLYLALIPIALVVLSIVIFVKRADVSAVVAGFLSLLWLALRFLI